MIKHIALKCHFYQITFQIITETEYNFRNKNISLTQHCKQRYHKISMEYCNPCNAKFRAMKENLDHHCFLACVLCHLVINFYLNFVSFKVNQRASSSGYLI